jgi:hypothetical protein
MPRYIQTVVKDEVHKALKVLAPQKEKTLGELVETAVEEYLEKEDKGSSQGEQGSVGGKE